MFTNQLDTCNVQSSVDVHESSWYLQRSVLCWCAQINLILATFRALLMCTNQLGKDTATFRALLMCTNHLGNSRRSELCWCARINLIKTQRRSELCWCAQISFTFTHDFHSWRLLAYELINTRLCMIRFHKHSWCSSLINALYRTSAFNAKPHDVYGWCYAAHITLARFRCKLQQDVNLLGIHKDDHIIHSRASASLNISWLSVSMKYGHTRNTTIGIMEPKNLLVPILLKSQKDEILYYYTIGIAVIISASCPPRWPDHASLPALRRVPRVII
jgi:hypothetical protein